MQQKIMCIKSNILFKKGKWNAMQLKNLDYYYKLLCEKSQFRKRQDLEDDTSYKQIIPQVILEHDNTYFLHRQVSANEKRLNSFCPLPLGGHVEQFDQNKKNDIIQTALLRELHEEVNLKSKIIDKKFIGLVYLEDENPVNHVHVGLLYIFKLDGTDVEMNEDSLEKIGWVTPDYLIKNITDLTYWSRIFVNKYLKKD